MRIDIENNNQSWHELFFRFPFSAEYPYPNVLFDKLFY